MSNTSNEILAATLYSLATTTATLLAKKVHVSVIDPFIATTSLQNSSREGSSTYQLICAPLDEI